MYLRGQLLTSTATLSHGEKTELLLRKRWETATELRTTYTGSVMLLLCQSFDQRVCQPGAQTMATTTYLGIGICPCTIQPCLVKTQKYLEESPCRVSVRGVVGSWWNGVRWSEKLLDSGDFYARDKMQGAAHQRPESIHRRRFCFLLGWGQPRKPPTSQSIITLSSLPPFPPGLSIHSSSTT